uniref:SLAM family member 7 n=1 Tax=Rhinolophus ferrumequinum TaxID=59479 RepID=A0A671FT35_RHIFE
MPGSPACFILIFLLCQLTEPAASGTLKKLVGALGGSVTFPLTHSVNQIDSIVWILNTTILVTIQPKMADRQDNIIVIQNHNKKRVNFPHGNYSLKLSKLNKSDSGTYRVEIYSSSLQGPFIQEYELHVYGSIKKKKRMDIHQEVLNYYPPSGETSEYDTISNINKTIPEENSINMLYSTVQIPKKMEKPHPLPTSPDTPRLFAYENVI